MSGRRVLLYYAWSRPAEIGAPLEIIENRFPALFESRRMLYPHFEDLSDPAHFNQSVAGFLDHIMKKNFADFVDFASGETGGRVAEIERVNDDGDLTPLDPNLLQSIDTLIVISFDSLRSGQEANAEEIEAVRAFLAEPDNIAFICPHLTSVRRPGSTTTRGFIARKPTSCITATKRSRRNSALAASQERYWRVLVRQLRTASVCVLRQSRTGLRHRL